MRSFFLLRTIFCCRFKQKVNEICSDQTGRLSCIKQPFIRTHMSTVKTKLVHGLPLLTSLILLAGIILPAIAAPPASAAKTYTDKSRGYSLAVPDNWEAYVKPGTGGRLVVFSGAKGTREYVTTISLQVVPRRSYSGMDAVAGDLIKQWKKLGGYKLLARQKGHLAQRPALRLLLEHRLPNGEQIYRREQFICLGEKEFYLLAYTAPVAWFDKAHPHMVKALDTFALTGVVPEGQPAAGHQEKMLAATFGPATLKQAGGPLYAPSYENGTYQGRQVAEAVRKMVGQQSLVLRELAKRQAGVLAAFDKMGAVQAEQAALLQAETDVLPPAVKNLFRLQAEYAILQQAQRGAVEGALAALPAPEKVSDDLAGVQALAALQLGLSDQQALIFKQNDEVWSKGMLIYQDLSKESSGLPAHTRLKLAQLNLRQQETALDLIAAADAMNQTMAGLIMVLDLWGEFQVQVGGAYAEELSRSLPGLKADAMRLRKAKPNDPALPVIESTIEALERLQQNLESQSKAAASINLWQYMGDLTVPPAHAGVMDFTKRFVENTYYAGRIAITATLNVPRLAAQGLGQAAERLGQELSYGSIKKLNVTSDPEAILPTADEIIKRDPEMAKHRDELVASLKKIKSRHQVENVQDYLQLKKNTIDANVAEYNSKQYGARALNGAVKSIDGLKAGLEKGAETYTQDLVRSVAGNLAANTVGYVAGKVNGFVAGVACGVLTDIPRSVAVLLNPKSSWAEHGKAYFDLGCSMGAAVSGMAKTAVAVGAKTFPKLAQVMKNGASLVGRMMPSGSKAAGVADDLLTPLIKKGKDMGQAAVQRVRQMDSGIVRKVQEGIEQGVKKVKDLAAKPLAKTGKEDLANIVKDVTKNLTAKDGDVLKNFVQNFTNKGLLDNAANGTFSDNVLLPILKMAEKTVIGEPVKKDQPVVKAAKVPEKRELAQAASGFSGKAAGGDKDKAQSKEQPEQKEKPKAEPQKRKKPHTARRPRRRKRSVRTSLWPGPRAWSRV